MKPKIHLVEEPSRAEINKQLAVMAIRLHRMKQHHKPGVQAELAAQRLEEYPDQTTNTVMARVLAGQTTRRWWQIWRRG